MALFPGQSFSAGCGSAFKQVDYSAHFSMTGRASQKGRIRVGMASEGGHQVWIARIDFNQRCQATCEVQRLEVEKFGGAAPVSLDLKCRSSGVLPLETKATVFFTSATQLEPSLRFGTWLDGYQEVPLAVERDTFSKANRSPAIAAR